MTTETQTIPLNKLAAWDGNVRKTAGADTALAELAASIAAHGLINPLTVIKAKKGKFSVVAGGRRLAALQSLASDGKIPGDHPIPCTVRSDDAEATEISLAENAVRERMHPADEFAAFLGLIEKGIPAEDIAARFGVTPRVVEQRLKLACVSPVILKAFRENDLTLAQVMAFAVSDDHAAQEHVYEQLSPYTNDPDDIRATLTENEIPATDRRVKFVSLKAYEKAGGDVRRDLFADGDDGVFILDPVLLDEIAARKLKETADAIAQEGWKWVEAVPAYAWSDWNDCQRRHPEALPLPAEQQEELDTLNAEYERISDTDLDLTDEQSARLDEITARCDELEDRERVWPPETLAIAGAVVSIGHDGEAEIHRGFIRPEDRPRKKPQAAKIDRINEDGTLETIEVEQAFAVPASLTETLTMHRTAALGVELMQKPEVALAALVHSFAAQTFLHGSSEDTCLQARIFVKSLDRIEDSKAAAAMREAHDIWGTRIPGCPDALWAWCLEQNRDVLLDLLAFCLGCGLNAVRVKTDRADAPRFAHADRLAVTLGLDLARWFTPTAENYFGKVAKPAIMEALTQAGRPTAPAWEKARKRDLAVIAEREIAGTGWLPEALRKPA